MKSGTVIFLLAIILSPMTVAADGLSETPRDPLIGEWTIAPSELRMYPHLRFVFSDDHTFTIYDEGERVIEKCAISASTDHSFVSRIIYAPEDYPQQDFMDTSTYAVYEPVGKNRINLRFYADDALTTEIATLYLDRTENRAGTAPSMAATPKSTSTDEMTSWRAENFVPAISIDFDEKLPDRTFFRNGGRLEVVSVPSVNKTRMGLITLPTRLPGTGGFGLPKGSFVVDYQGTLANTIAGFRTFIPGILPYGSRSPYFVLAVTVDDDLEPDAYVVGRSVTGLEESPLPEQTCPVQTWLECRLDANTLVHVAGFRGNLGGEFTTRNYGPLGSLVKRTLRDGTSWGDLNIVFIEICAGVGAGPAFRAYVDDITVGSRSVPQFTSALSTLEELCRDLISSVASQRHVTIAIPGFATKRGTSSPLTEELDLLMSREAAQKGNLVIVESDQIEAILQDQSLGLIDLMDTDKAIDVGDILSADYILTGVVVEMPSSVDVVGRVIDVADGHVVMTRQVTVQR